MELRIMSLEPMIHEQQKSGWAMMYASYDVRAKDRNF